MRIPGTTFLASTWMQRDNASALQTDLTRAQNELSTGRHADVGLTLGLKVGRNLGWRMDLSRLESFQANNKLTLDEADVSQNTLDSIKTVASKFVDTLLAARSAQNGQTLAKQAAQDALASFTTMANVNFNGKYLFAGQNSTQAPIGTYAGGAGEAALDTAFQGSFGTTNTDPALSSQTPASMQAYLQGSFSQLFDDPSWQANFSAATAGNVLARTDASTQVDASASTDEQAFRNIMKGILAVAESGTGNLNSNTFNSVLDFATGSMATGMQQLTDAQSRIGFAQQSVARTNDSISRRIDIIKGQITDSEGVDTTELSVRVNTLMTQLEMSYAVTSRVSKLSLLNYL